MKALDILKTAKQYGFNGRVIYVSDTQLKDAKKELKSLEQRIKELEAENARISMHLDRERDDAVHYCKVIAELESPKTCE